MEQMGFPQISSIAAGHTISTPSDPSTNRLEMSQQSQKEQQHKVRKYRRWQIRRWETTRDKMFLFFFCIPNIDPSQDAAGGKKVMETKNKLKKQATSAGGWIKSWTMCGTGKPPISTTSHQASPSAVQTDRNSQSATQPATQPSQSMTTSNVGQRQDEGSNPRWREENKNHLEKRSKLNKRQKKNWDRSEKKERIQWNGGRSSVVFPSNSPEMSHREWAASSAAKY